MSHAVASRPASPAVELTADDLLSLGAFEAAEVDLVPGDTVFDYSKQAGAGERFKANFIYNGDDGRGAEAAPSELVVLYHCDGRPMTVKRELAKYYLTKPTGGCPHRNEPHFKSFYARPVMEFPAPTLRCPSERGGCGSGGRDKMFQTPLQRDRHFRSRHKEEFAAIEDAKATNRDDRGLALQESMVAILRAIAAGQPVSAHDALAALAETDPPPPPVVPEPEWPNESWTRQSLIKWVANDGRHDGGEQRQELFRLTKLDLLQWIENEYPEGKLPT